MKDGKIEISPLLDSLNDEDKNNIIASAIQHTHSRGKTVPLSDHEQNVYYVLEGRLKVVAQASSGKEQILYFLEANDYFVEPEKPFFLNNNVKLVTLTDVKLLLIKKDILFNVLFKYSELCLCFIENILVKNKWLEYVAVNLSLLDAERRIAVWLCHVCENEHSKTPKKLVRIVTTHSRYEIATLLGITQETLSRSLVQLRKKGLLKTQGHKAFVIPDYIKLCYFARL